jgi:hypothetical protein
MAASGFSDNLEQFVRANISSVEQVEVLLLAHRTAPRHWTAIAASRELRLDPVSVARRLTDFNDRGLLSVRAGEDALEYWYEQSSAAPDRTLVELDRAYRERRTSLINLIFSPPADEVRAFADAFRLRKKED